MKRFTETEKWIDDWFVDLSDGEKLLYLHSLDTCDPAGVFKSSERILKVLITDLRGIEELMDKSEGRIEKLPNGKYWLTKFCSFQYHNGISETAKVHSKVRDSIKKNNLPIPIGDVSNTSRIPIADVLKSSHGTSQDKGTATDKDTGKETDTELNSEILMSQGNYLGALASRIALSSSEIKEIAKKEGATAEKFESWLNNRGAQGLQTSKGNRGISLGSQNWIGDLRNFLRLWSSNDEKNGTGPKKSTTGWQPPENWREIYTEVTGEGVDFENWTDMPTWHKTDFELRCKLGK